MRRGFTIVEIMMVVILLTLILTALYQVFRSTQKGASK